MTDTDLVERLVVAMLATKVCGPCDIKDYFGDLTPGDAIDLGVNLTEKDANGKPRFHWYSDIRCDEYDDAYKAILRPLARASIEAMMEPTEAMIEASVDGHGLSLTSAHKQVLRDGHARIFRAMLSASLTEKQP